MNQESRIKEIKLYIDTTNNKEIIVALEIDGAKDEIRQVVGERRAQVVLPLIDSLLQKHNVSIKDVSNIIVNEGPGSFTGIRVGVTIANTLGTVLNVPINTYPVGTHAKPTYE